MEIVNQKYGKTFRAIMQAWTTAKANPGKRIAVVSKEGTMVLEFMEHKGFVGHEITEIEIDGKEIKCLK